MSLLITKLYMPPVSQKLVGRPRLIGQLDEGLRSDHRLTLVSAPAGFGKTTLLSDWLRHTDRPSAWLSVDDGDNDPARFLAYLIAALQKIDPSLGQTARVLLQASQGPPVESLLTNLVNDIAAASEPFILVLDDYHLVGSPSIHQALSFLLDHLPPPGTGMHLVVATRADPPLPVARLRARGQLTELHAADLRFTARETEAFLNEAMGLALAADHVQALEKRTEGWITGLQLAALSIAGRDDVPAFIAGFTGSHRYVIDYLTEEVLSRQSEEVREFLLQTAILERLTGTLCDAVRFGIAEPPSAAGADAVRFGDAAVPAGQTSGQQILEVLEAANLFLVPLDGARRWYRYHRLFVDILRQRLACEQAALVPELHRRAAAWYVQAGMIPDAVSHALHCGDFEQAASLIEQAGWATFTRGEMATILRWIAALPDDFVRARTQLSVLHAWALAKSGDLDGAEESLHDVDDDHLCGESTAVRAYVAGVRGDLPRAVQLSRQALDLLPGVNLVLRAIVAQNLGVAYHWSGAPDEATSTLAEAVELSRAAGQSFQTLTAMAILGRAYEMRGALRQAMDTYAAALELGTGADSRPAPFACMAYVGKAGVLYEWNDLDGATRHVLEGIRLSELGGFVAYQVFGHGLLARIYHARGDLDEAVEHVEKAERLGQGHRYALVMALVTELRVRLWLAQGDLSQASDWAKARRLPSTAEVDAAGEIERIALAQVLIAQDRLDGALDLTAQLLDAAQAAGRVASAIKLLALQAIAFQARNDTAQAGAALARALSLAEPEGHVRTFVDEGEPMAALLRQALVQGIAPGYAADLLSHLAHRGGAESLPRKAGVDPPLVEPLTTREVEVLRLIAAGLSNREIAEELVIALSTVKSHINHLYGKLEVKNRTQAVARAQELGLL